MLPVQDHLDPTLRSCDLPKRQKNRLQDLDRAGLLLLPPYTEGVALGSPTSMWDGYLIYYMPHLVSALRFDRRLSFHEVNKIKFRFVKIRKSLRENSSLSSYLPTRIPFLLSFGLAILFTCF